MNSTHLTSSTLTTIEETPDSGIWPAAVSHDGSSMMKCPSPALRLAAGLADGSGRGTFHHRGAIVADGGGPNAAIRRFLYSGQCRRCKMGRVHECEGGLDGTDSEPAIDHYRGNAG